MSMSIAPFAVQVPGVPVTAPPAALSQVTNTWFYTGGQANISYAPWLPPAFFPYPTNRWWSSWTHPHTGKPGTLSEYPVRLGCWVLHAAAGSVVALPGWAHR